jgi:hypothetical protein
MRTEMITATLRGKLAEAFADFAAVDLLAYTAREGDYVIASTLCERRAS